MAEAATSRKKASRGFESPWWSQEVEAALEGARRAERNYKTVRTIYHYDRLQESQQALSKALNIAKTIVWRSTLQRATEQSDLL